MQFSKYLALPPEITPVEQQFLFRLNALSLVFLYLHVPVLTALAAFANTEPVLALGLGLIVMVAPTLACETIQNPRTLSVVYGISAVFMGSLLVHFGQGPAQVQLHSYFFVLLAILCLFANPMVNLAAAITLVFTSGASVYAVFLILETIPACFIARTLFDNMLASDQMARTQSALIHQHQSDIATILNNVQPGLAAIDRAGRLSGECSPAMKAWFGPPIEGEKLAAWIGRKDPRFGRWLALSMDNLTEGFLPVEVALAQLPARLKMGDTTYDVQYQTMSGNADSKILVVITPITIDTETMPDPFQASAELRTLARIMEPAAKQFATTAQS